MANYVLLITDCITGKQTIFVYSKSEFPSSHELLEKISYPGPAMASILVDSGTGNVIYSAFGTVHNHLDSKEIKTRLKYRQNK